MRQCSWKPMAWLVVAVTLPAWTAGGRAPVFLDDDAWARAVRERGVDPGLFDNPVAATPAMEAAAREYVFDGDDTERLRALQAALFDPKRFTFEYESEKTLTAREAFEARRGNCVSFVNLFIALARALDIRVRPAILKAVQDVELEGDLLVINTHLVAIHERPHGIKVFDFYRSRQDVPVTVRPLDDLDLNAIYLNNLGVERLRAGELEASAGYFEAAIALAPDFAEAYANLGVARRRTGDTQGALDAYFGGLGVDPDNRRILHNLGSLYRAAAAADDAPDAGRPSGDAPVTAREVVARADADLVDGNLRRARQLYLRAHRMDPARAEPLVGAARVEILRGRPDAARRWLERALEVEPDDRVARELLDYLRRTDAPR